MRNPEVSESEDFEYHRRDDLNLERIEALREIADAERNLADAQRRLSVALAGESVPAASVEREVSFELRMLNDNAEMAEALIAIGLALGFEPPTNEHRWGASHVLASAKLSAAAYDEAWAALPERYREGAPSDATLADRIDAMNQDRLFARNGHAWHHPLLNAPRCVSCDGRGCVQHDGSAFPASAKRGDPE